MTRKRKGHLKSGELVQIIWEDILSSCVWESEMGMKSLDVVTVLSVGWVHTSNDRIVRIYASKQVSGGADKSEATVIPRGCIKEIVRL